ncbi:MAG: TIR domain-containing protein [Chloroflexi bacterium]|nr:TIR domain-containing protein [Chloroflexota bacterium]
MVTRRVFFSFHYKPDNWRAGQVRNMGMVEGNAAVSDNDWETVTRGGDAAIRRWIDGQLHGKSCAVVLIGSQTAGRKWIKYEIEKAWKDGKGLLGIYIHGLQDRYKNQSTKGQNPFGFNVEGRNLSRIVKAYDPPYRLSENVYKHIADNMANWVEEAITIRGRY